MHSTHRGNWMKKHLVWSRTLPYSKKTKHIWNLRLNLLRAGWKDPGLDPAGWPMIRKRIKEACLTCLNMTLTRDSDINLEDYTAQQGTTTPKGERGDVHLLSALVSLRGRRSGGRSRFRRLRLKDRISDRGLDMKTRRRGNRKKSRETRRTRRAQYGERARRRGRRVKQRQEWLN